MKCVICGAPTSWQVWGQALCGPHVDAWSAVAPSSGEAMAAFEASDFEWHQTLKHPPVNGDTQLKQLKPGLLEQRYSDFTRRWVVKTRVALGKAAA